MKQKKMKMTSDRAQSRQKAKRQQSQELNDELSMPEEFVIQRLMERAKLLRLQRQRQNCPPSETISTTEEQDLINSLNRTSFPKLFLDL